MPDEPHSQDRTVKRRTPAHFRLADTALVQDLLAGADQVASRSFLGSGGQSTGPYAVSRALPGSGPQRSEWPPGECVSSPVSPPDAAESVDAADGADPGVAVADPGTVAWSHTAVQESFADAKLSSSRWKAHGFRIAPDVLARLKSRVNADRRHTGNANLAIGHYVDAALRHMPQQVSELIAMAEEFGARQLWDSEKTQPSTYRVGEKAYELASSLKVVLQEADYGRRGTQVISAGIQVFLDVLDAQGPLTRPVCRHR
ncbi:hypothetical protein AB8O64_36260 (plasmid) [Streptomyces sp. QH1-20]|uniref:hypothetical protein n=1 Tax=Streptomyces sp. QH1-20 TaxID=3240934 RepID=UPI0035197082